jgi:hypothetical protein
MEIVTGKDLREALEKLTKHDIYDIERNLQFKVKAFLHSPVNATKEEMFRDIGRFIRQADNEDKKKLIDAIQAKLAEKAQLPVRGEVPNTRYIKWSDFSNLPSYPTISRAVHYPHNYKQKCHPMTKDGYVSVDAIYNMAAWANWKSSSLSPSEMATASAINNLPLLSLMQLNKGRRMDQPALFPAGLLPIAPYIDHSHPAGMPFDLYASGPDTITWATDLEGRLVYVKVKGVDIDRLLRVGMKQTLVLGLTRTERIKAVLGHSIALVDRITPGRWLPYAGAEYSSGTTWFLTKVWWMATFEEGPVTITVEGIRVLSQVELENIFQNTSALIGISKAPRAVVPSVEEPTTVGEMVEHNKRLLNQYREEFQQTFGVALSKFMHPMFGFDIVAFDSWLGTPDGTSTADYLAKTKGKKALTLVESLLR